MACEIVDIRELNALDLASLLETESEVWRERLRWDFADSARLISTCLEERRISGYALVVEGRVKGYCFFFCDGDKGLIGNLFTESTDTGFDLALPLLERAIKSLMSEHRVCRIESQLPHFTFEQLNACFRAHCFEGYRRRFMSVPLTLHREGREEASRAGQTPIFQDFMIQRWERKHDRAASELLYVTYSNHVDAAINDQYSSLAGTTRLLENIVNHCGCGRYLPRASIVAIHRSTEKLAAVLAFTAVQPQTAHIPQIAVAKEFQSAGLGTTMLETSLAELAKGEYQQVSLTVTDLNAGAVRLYERLGFQTFKTFGAFVWNKQR